MLLAEPVGEPWLAGIVETGPVTSVGAPEVKPKVRCPDDGLEPVGAGFGNIELEADIVGTGPSGGSDMLGLSVNILATVLVKKVLVKVLV